MWEGLGRWRSFFHLGHHWGHREERLSLLTQSLVHTTNDYWVPAVYLEQFCAAERGLEIQLSDCALFTMSPSSGGEEVTPVVALCVLGWGRGRATKSEPWEPLEPGRGRRAEKILLGRVFQVLGEGLEQKS